MVFYSCRVGSCEHNNTLTTDRRFIFNHYIKHLKRDLNETAVKLGILNKPYHENKYSLINTLVDHSITKELKF